VQKSENTVFVSNLDFSTTEQQLTDFFSKSGSITELRLVKNYAGKSKGFAYVIYSSSNEVKHALNRDKELLCGRPAYISEHDPD
jgi:RNA recognition motif-containing protein